MIQLDFRSRIKNPTPTSSVLRIPTPPKNLRLFATPTPQPCLQPNCQELTPTNKTKLF